MLVVDKDAIDRAQPTSIRRSPSRRLPAYAPVVAGEMIATVKIIPFAVAGDARDAALAAARGAKPIVRVAPFKRPQGRHHLDAAAGPRRQGDREDPEGDRRAARARGRDASSPSGACRTRPRRSRRRSTRCSKAGAETGRGVRRLRDRRPARRDPGGGRGGRRAHRAFRHAGRSRQPAAGRPRRTAGRCSARPAARARRRRTASTGC